MFELSTVLSLSDWFVKLLDYGNKRKKAFFEEVIKPCHASAKAVRNDLVSIYSEIEKSLVNNQTLPEIEGLIFTRRAVELATRDELRAQLRHMPPEGFTKFEQGIFSLLEGRNTHALMRLHVDVKMTLRHIEKLEQSGDAQAAALRKQELLNSVAKARKTAEEAWRQIADGFALYQLEYLRHPA